LPTRKRIVIPADKLALSFEPGKFVHIHIHEREELGLMPESELILALTPTETRSFAATLLRKADEAEA
jgi:hypothetical protein